MTDAGARVQYAFDAFQLDIQQRLLMTGPECRPVPLAPRVFDTLLYLVERRGELLDNLTLLKLHQVHHDLFRDSSYSEVLTRRMLYWYVQLGALDRAFALLDESLARFARLWMQEMTAFRQRAKFAALIERFGLMPHWERFGPPDGRELRRGKLVVS